MQPMRNFYSTMKFVKITRILENNFLFIIMNGALNQIFVHLKGKIGRLGKFFNLYFKISSNHNFKVSSSTLSNAAL